MMKLELRQDSIFLVLDKKLNVVNIGLYIALHSLIFLINK